MKIELEFKTALFLFAIFVVLIVAWREPKEVPDVLGGMAFLAGLAGFFWWMDH